MRWIEDFIMNIAFWIVFVFVVLGLISVAIQFLFALKELGVLNV